MIEYGQILISSKMFSQSVVEGLGFTFVGFRLLKPMASAAMGCPDGIAQLYSYVREEDALALIELMRQEDARGFSTKDIEYIQKLIK